MQAVHKELAEGQALGVGAHIAPPNVSVFEAALSECLAACIHKGARPYRDRRMLMKEHNPSHANVVLINQSRKSMVRTKAPRDAKMTR